MENEQKEIQFKFSKDGLCAFDPEWSSFMLAKDGSQNFNKNNVIRLRSWSKIIKQYKNEVDSDKLACEYAKKHGLDMLVVLKQWKDKADASKLRGNLVHAYLDEYFRTGVMPPIVIPEQAAANKMLMDFYVNGRLTSVESEFVAYSKKWQTATLIDNIAKAKGLYYIIDWKTNEEIKENSYGKNMLGPFDQLPDHSMMEYKLQVNYQKHLAPPEYPIAGMYLGHITASGYRLIPVPDMQLDMDILCGGNQDKLPF